ncbi:UNVERIFIED_CONTAM: E3 ubiquitin-protein ligase Jade-2 [Gekko kuhli]
MSEITYFILEQPEMDEFTLERVLEELETLCYENMNIAIETEEGLGIEYDEDVVCDVCRSPEGEDGNEMVFCDKCNVCVHQASHISHWERRES